jgi:hypothetical protein
VQLGDVGAKVDLSRGRHELNSAGWDGKGRQDGVGESEGLGAGEECLDVHIVRARIPLRG